MEASTIASGPGPDPTAGGLGRWSALWKAALAAGCVGAGVFGTSAYAAYRLCRPRRFLGGLEPPDGDFEQVDFPSADGLRLRGWYLPPFQNGGGVILCHGFHTGRREMLPLAQALRDRGHGVLLFDFRGHGESEGQWTSCGPLETRDLEGAVRYLLARPDMASGRVGVVGFSMGAAVALLTAARVPEIGAVVADSSFATFKGVVSSGFRKFRGLPTFPFANLAIWMSERLLGVRIEDNRPVDAIVRIAPRPVLLIHGADDDIVPLSEAYLLYEAAGEHSELWTVAGADHVGARELDFQAYVERVDRFLRRALPQGGDGVVSDPEGLGDLSAQMERTG